MWCNCLWHSSVIYRCRQDEGQRLRQWLLFVIVCRTCLSGPVGSGDVPRTSARVPAFARSRHSATPPRTPALSQNRSLLPIRKGPLADVDAYNGRVTYQTPIMARLAKSVLRFQFAALTHDQFGAPIASLKRGLSRPPEDRW